MSNIYTNDELAKASSIAQFRLSLIAPVVQGLLTDPSATAYYQRITKEPLTLPDGSVVQYSYKTIEKWTSMYKQHGFEALMPHSRSDKGSTRALTDSAIEEIYQVREKFPGSMPHRSTTICLNRDLFPRRSVSVRSSASSGTTT